jgi:hypothetical protein
MQGAAQASEADSELPFTGLSVLGLLLTGMLFLLTGKGLLISGSKRGPRIPTAA